jgi:hypothetical protein
MNVVPLRFFDEGLEPTPDSLTTLIHKPLIERQKEDNISKLYDDLVFNVKFSVDEYQEIVKNYLAELHISNEALISNLQSA